MGVPRLYRWIDSTFKRVLSRTEVVALKQAVLAATAGCDDRVDSVLVDFNSFLYVAARNMEIGNRALGQVDVAAKQRDGDEEAGRINARLDSVRGYAQTVADWLVRGMQWTIESTEILKRSLLALGTLLVALDPHVLVVVALDGPAPAAKRHQQRRRRYRAAEDIKKLALKYGSSVKRLIARRGFDGCAVHPGTSFMEKVDQGVRRFLQLVVAAGGMKLQGDPATRMSASAFSETLSEAARPAAGPGPILRRGCRVVYSGCFSPGEGEHKMAEWARAQLSGHLPHPTVDSGEELTGTKPGRGAESAGSLHHHAGGAGQSAGIAPAEACAPPPAVPTGGAVVLVSPDADLALLGLAIDASVRFDAARKSATAAGVDAEDKDRDGAASAPVLADGSVTDELAASIEAAPCRIVVLRTSEEEAPQDGGKHGEGEAEKAAGHGSGGAASAAGADPSGAGDGGQSLVGDDADGEKDREAQSGSEEDEEDEDDTVDISKALQQHQADAAGKQQRYKSGKLKFELPGPDLALPNRSVFEVFNVGSWRRQLPVWMLSASASRASHMTKSSDEGGGADAGGELGHARTAQAARDRIAELGGMARSHACLDMVMLSCFLGNDFLPLLPGLKLDKRGLQTIAGAWRVGTRSGELPFVQLLVDDGAPSPPLAADGVVPAGADSASDGSTVRASGQPIFRFGFRCSIDVHALAAAMRVIAAVVEPGVTGSILDGIEANSEDEDGDVDGDGGEGEVGGFDDDEDDGGFGDLMGDGAGGGAGEDDEFGDDGGFADLLREDSAGSTASAARPVAASEEEACPVMASGMESYYSTCAWGLSSGAWTDAWAARESFLRVVPDPMRLPEAAAAPDMIEAGQQVDRAVLTSPPTVAWKRLPHDAFPSLPGSTAGPDGASGQSSSSSPARKWKRQESDTRRVWSAAAAMVAQWWAGLCFVSDYYVDGLRSWDFEYLELYAPLPSHAAELLPTTWSGGAGGAAAPESELASVRALRRVGGLCPPSVGRWWDVSAVRLQLPAASGSVAGSDDAASTRSQERQLFRPRFAQGRPAYPMDALFMILGPESHSLLPRLIGKPLRQRLMHRELVAVQERLQACEAATKEAFEEVERAREQARAANKAAGVTGTQPAPKGSLALAMEQQASAAHGRAHSLDKERRQLRSKASSLAPSRARQEQKEGEREAALAAGPVPPEQVAVGVGMSGPVLDAIWPDFESVRVDSESAMRVYDEKEFVPRVPRWLAEALVTAAGSDGHGVVGRLWRRAEEDLVMVQPKDDDPEPEAGAGADGSGVWRRGCLLKMDASADSGWAAEQVAAVDEAKAKTAAVAEERRLRRKARKAAEAAARAAEEEKAGE